MKQIRLSLEDFAVDTFATEPEEMQAQAMAVVAAKTIGCRPTEYFCDTVDPICPSMTIPV